MIIFVRIGLFIYFVLIGGFDGKGYVGYFERFEERLSTETGS